MFSGYAFFYHFVDCSPVLADYFYPGKFSHHGEVDSAETHAGYEDVDAVAKRLVFHRFDGFGYCFRAVGVVPSVADFGVSFVDGHP